MRANSQDAVNEFRPYFDNAPVYGHGPSLEDFTRETPLTVGSPQQVIERTLGFRGLDVFAPGHSYDLIVALGGPERLLGPDSRG